MSKLVLIRHGESRWNLSNCFTGWADIPLSEAGIEEAKLCASELNGTKFHVAFTSELERAHATLLMILAQQHRTGVFQHETGKRKMYYQWQCNSNHCSKDDMPIFTSERLNERYYGKLQGMNKDDARKKYGDKRVYTWRRTFKGKPPAGESLEEVYKRMIPYFKKRLQTAVMDGQNVLLVGHGNTLRVLIKFLNDIADEDMPLLDLPFGKPITYSYKRKCWCCENPEAYSFNRPLR